MRKYSSNKDINSLIRKLKKNGWTYYRRKTHGFIISPLGIRSTVPCSPSDRRAFSNFKKEIKRIEKGIQLYAQ